jgi:cobalt-zinc-cadmium efflux system outer membrane protein
MFFVGAPGGPFAATLAHAEEAQVAPPKQALGFSEAVRLARSRGFDVLVASAQVRGAEADIRSAGALPNPALNANVGWTLSCGASACASGSPWGWGIGAADQGLIEGALSGKRTLKERVARYGFDAAKYGRKDVERMLVAQTKVQYVVTAAAAHKVDFEKEVAASLQKSVEVNRVRYPRVIDEGQLLRVEQEAMRAEQEVGRAERDFREQQIDLIFLTGFTGPAPVLDVDKEIIKFRVPEALASSNRNALYSLALENRPDRRQAAAKEAQSDAQIALARRQRVPDISLNVQYQQQGTLDYNSQLPTLTVGATLPIPVFYQQQGEIQRAEADREAAAMSRRKIDATLANDIDSAYNALVLARTIIERYESGLLDRARRAREITQVQYVAGSATLTDLLDAQRTFVQVNVDYQAELVNYWTAVFQLEQAVGKELVP